MDTLPANTVTDYTDAALLFSPAVLDAGEYAGKQDGVTSLDAVKVAQAAAAFLSGHGEYALMGQGPRGGDGPFACGPGFHADGWTVAYEGDYDWPWRLTERLFIARTAAAAGETITDGDAALLALTEGVFLEPVTGWSLGIYPHH